MGQERRKHPRLRFEVPVDIKSGHYLYVARTDDISEGGVFLRTPAAIRLGSTVHLHLRVGDATVSVIGKVCWSKPTEDGKQEGVGVQFYDMSPYARTVLRNFMRTNAPAFYGEPQQVAAPPRPQPPRPQAPRPRATPKTDAPAEPPPAE
jgi:uncharacterized protein (TIGR02266 family)